MPKSQLVQAIGSSLPKSEALEFYAWILTQPSKREIELRAMQYGMNKWSLSRFQSV